MLYGSGVADGTGYLRIGELARRTGTSPELLRAWEQRYGLLAPSRSSGGFRLYSDEDEARVTARCTGGAKAELRVRSHDEGQLRVEITLRNRNSARPWTVVVVHERRLAYRGRLERGRGTLRLTIADLPGRDAVVIRARGAAREACSAAAAVFGR